jgi:hypothetical protein
MNQHRELTPTIPRGHQFERDFFGIHSREIEKGELPVVTSINPRALRMYCYDTFQHETYSWDPTYPHTDMAGYLYEKIREVLPEKSRDKLRFYCLLGTSADRHFGVDMIITLRGKTKIVLVDLTTNTRKTPKSKDILILQRYFITNAWEENSDTRYLMNFVDQVVEILQPTARIIYLENEN